MKKLLLSFVLVLFAIFSSANQVINISGTVTDENTGLGIPNHIVFISTDSTANCPVYFINTLTGPDGNYFNAFEMPDNCAVGTLSVFTFDCNGIIEFQQVPYGNGNYQLMANFQICNGGIPPYDCYADFWWWQNEVLTVQFQDASWPDPSSWAWNFGDGQTSNLQNPIHQFANAGMYMVSLTTTNQTGCTSTASWEVYVENYNFNCKASFYWMQSWMDPLTVEFYDYSWFTPGTWNWQFGDGQFSTEQNPVHTYSQPGIYEVKLTINGADSTCYDQYSEILYIEEFPYDCYADFWWYQTGISTVQFQNFSFPPNSSSFWDFGDGTTSTETNPAHIFAGLGAYEVCLTVGDPAIGCQDTRCYEVWVDTNNYIECKADFWYWQMDELTVQFQDYSWPMPTIWAWDFGDGQSSTEQNPIHQYSQTGIYNVTLTIYAEETGCTSTAVYEIWVDNINYGCDAKYFWVQSPNAPLTIEFYDASMYNTPVSWFWDFGDGSYSSEQNPVHTYSTENNYMVCLTISAPDSSCYSQFCGEVSFGGVINPDCYSDFNVIDQGNLTFTFEGFLANGTTGNNVQYFWDFGDNNVGQGQIVTHTFSMPGSYAVCLTTISVNPADSCFYTSCKGVFAGNGGGGLQAGFTMQPDSMNPMIYHFFDTSTGNPNFWLWNFGDGNYSISQNPTHQYAQNGWYDVCLTIMGQGMTDTYCTGFEMTAGALNISSPEQIINSGEVFPNPNSGVFTLDIELSKATKVNISVINFIGQEVYTRNDDLSAGNSKLAVDLANLPQGIYNLILISENQKITKKFIIR